MDEKDRNLNMARVFTFISLAFIFALAAMLYMGIQAGPGLIHKIAFGCFYLGPLPCIVISATGVAFANLAVKEDNRGQGYKYRTLGFIEIFIFAVATLVAMYMIKH